MTMPSTSMITIKKLAILSENIDLYKNIHHILPILMYQGIAVSCNLHAAPMSYYFGI
jgi:hypothetical protein